MAIPSKTFNSEHHISFTQQWKRLWKFISQ